MTREEKIFYRELSNVMLRHTDNQTEKQNTTQSKCIVTAQSKTPEHQ